jgi:signal peptidase I
MEFIFHISYVTLSRAVVFIPFTTESLSMAPPKDHAVGDLLIVAKLELIWFICCILMENS